MTLLEGGKRLFFIEKVISLSKKLWILISLSKLYSLKTIADLKRFQEIVKRKLR
jgi:hypothetical protein